MNKHLIKKELEEMFGYESEYHLMMKEFDNTLLYILYSKLDLNANFRVILSNKIKLTEYCKAKIFVRENFFVFCVWGLIILIVSYFLIMELRKRKNFRIAKNLYKCIMLDIYKNKKVIININLLILIDQI